MGDTKVTYSADVKDAKRGIREMFREQSKFTQGVLRNNRKLATEAGRLRKKMVDMNESSFGSSTISKIKMWGASFVGAGAAIGGINAALNVMNQRIERGVTNLRQMEFPVSKLGQITGPGARFAHLKGEAEEISKLGGVSMGEASQLEFSLRSLGLSENRKMFAQLYGVADPVAIAEGVFSLRKHFGAQAGDPRATAGMLFRAAKESRVGASTLAPAVSQFAGAAPAIGADITETLATLASTEGLAPSPEEAATRLKSFAIAAAKNFPQQAQGGFVQTARGIEGLGLTQQQLIKKLPRQALFGLQDVLKSQGQITSLRPELAQIRSGQVDAFGNMMTEVESDPLISLQRRRRRAVSAQAIAESKTTDVLAEEAAQVQIAKIRTRAAEGDSAFGSLVAEAAIFAIQTALPKSLEPMGLGDLEFGATSTRDAVLEKSVNNGMRKGMQANTLAPVTTRGDRVENDDILPEQL